MSVKPASLTELIASLTHLDRIGTRGTARRANTREWFGVLKAFSDWKCQEIEQRGVSTGGRTGTKLLAQLRAVHPCAHPGAGGFEQLPTIAHVREWRCSGCGTIVTLPKGGAK